MDDWTSLMYATQKAFTNFAWVYFIGLVIMGSFFIMNLILVVIKVKFSETIEKVQSEKLIMQQKKNQKKNKVYNLSKIKEAGL